MLSVLCFAGGGGSGCAPCTSSQGSCWCRQRINRKDSAFHLPLEYLKIFTHHPRPSTFTVVCYVICTLIAYICSCCSSSHFSGIFLSFDWNIFVYANEFFDTCKLMFWEFFGKPAHLNFVKFKLIVNCWKATQLLFGDGNNLVHLFQYRYLSVMPHFVVDF